MIYYNNKKDDINSNNLFLTKTTHFLCSLCGYEYPPLIDEFTGSIKKTFDMTDYSKIFLSHIILKHPDIYEKDGKRILDFIKKKEKERQQKEEMKGV